MGQLNIQLTINLDGSITASWDAIPNVIRYKAYMLAEGETHVEYIEDNLMVTSYTSKPKLEANKIYKVIVGAFVPSGSGQKEISESARIVFPADFYRNVPVDVPANVSAVAETTTITVSFDEVTNATSYDILFDNVVYNIKTTSKRFTGLEPKTSHTYAVRSKNTKYTSDYSPIRTIKTLSLTPAVPTGIKKSVTENSATISWNESAYAEGYEIIFNGSTYSLTSTSKTFTGLTSGRKYEFKIRAKNSDAASAYSSTMTVTTAPKCPTNIVAECTDAAITIRWSQVDGAVGYYVQFNKSDYYTVETWSQFSGLQPNTTYTYRVCSKSEDGVGSYSTEQKITTPKKGTAVPTGISQESTENSVTVKWSAVNGATGYDILFNNSTYSVSETSKTFTGLSPNRSYNYRIRSKSSEGVGEYGETRTVKTTPNAPTSITVTSHEDSVTLSWGAVSGASSYDVLVNGKVYNVTDTSLTVTGLNPNTSYSYQVRVRNEDGVSSYSAAKTAKTTPNPPLSATATATQNSVTISWNAVNGATSYDVLFNGKEYRVTGTSKTITGLTAGTSYTYSVRSNSADGSSNYCDEKKVTTIPYPPSMPTNISATATDRTATISWYVVSNADSYDVLFNGTVYSTTDTSKTITGLTPSTSYTYAVRANNTGGSSSYSSTRTIKTTVAAPGVPTNISATATSSSVTVKWDSVSGATGYELVFNGTTYSVSTTSKTISGLSANTSYSYKVCAKNSAGLGAYSSTMTVKTLMGAPSTPTNVSATATTNSVTVKWDSVSGATGYTVRFNNSTYNVTSTSKTFTGLQPWTYYSYAVCATNAGGSSAYSSSRSIQTEPLQLNVPTNVKAVATTNSVTLSWSAVSTATSYDVRFGGTIYSVQGTEKTFDELPTNTQYEFAVRARSSSGYSNYSNQQTVRTLLDIPTNIQTTSTWDSVSISWDSVNGATGYEVNFNGKAYSVSGPSVEVTDLKPGTTYSFTLRAKNEFVSSEYSQSQEVKTLREIPNSPLNVRATSTINTVTVDWDTSDRASSYDIIFDDVSYNVKAEEANEIALFVFNAGIGGAISGVCRTAATSSMFSGLQPNTKHTYCVRANNEGGSSDYSPRQTITTKTDKQSGLPNSKSNKTYMDGKIPYTGLDPVNALTGAFLWSYTYLNDFGKDALHFTAMYDSQRDEYAAMMGHRWTYSLNYLLYMDSEYAYFSTPYDEVVSFRRNPENDSFELTDTELSSYVMGRKEDRTYYVRDIDGAEYIFGTNMCLKEIVENGRTVYRFTSNEQGQITAIEGRYGAKLTLKYADGHISQVSDVMGNTVAFTYNGERLISAVNSNGNQMSFTYDEYGDLVEISDFAGEKYLSNDYDIFGRVVAQTTAGKGKSFVTYDEANRVTTFTDELGNETKYHYDTSMRVTEIQYPGSNVKNKYGEDGRLSEQIDGLGNSTKMEYDERGRINHTIYPDGTEESIIYNDRNYPVKMVNRDGSESLYAYDDRNNLISAQDERGNKCFYTYDDQDNLVSYTDKSANVWTYAYDTNNHLEQATDPEGNIYQYTHDTIGRMLSYTTPEGKTTTYQYSSAGDLLKIVDSDGTVKFDYNENGNNTGITDRMGNRQRLEYNEIGQVTLATDFMGNEYKFTYDPKGNLVKETDPLGYSHSYEYDALGNRTAWTDKNGAKTKYSFNAGSQLTEVTDAAGNLIKYVYDTVGRVKAVTDALNNRTTYAYDAMGRITSVTNAMGDSVSYTYDQMGNLLTKTDENGVVISYTYDVENRLSSIMSDLGTVLFTYDKLDRVIAIQDTDGHTEETEYDGDGNITAITDKESSRTVYSYDASGRLSEETNPDGGKTSYKYDANGNCIKVTDAEGNESLYEYDANNRLVKETDPLGYETSYEYDARGDLVSVTDARGGITTFAYDGNGNLVSRVNPLGGTMTYTYDSLNRLIKTVDEVGNESTIAYDANGNMTQYTDANKNQWTYKYDVLNRLTNVIDQNGGCLAFEYTKTGQTAKVADQEGAETTYLYDSMGRLVEMTDALGNSLSFTYDSLGRVLTRTDANGNITEYEYSPSGNLICVKDAEDNVTSYTYNALGQVLTETNALGNMKSYEYDALGHVTSVTDALGGKISFVYTGNGQIESVTDANDNTYTYQYDACGNLSQVTDSMGNVTAFEYDAMNNQIKECLAVSGEQKCITIYQYDQKGRMIREINPVADEKSYTYDANGNLASVIDEDENETIIRYDLNNRPVNMIYSDGKEALFRYNKRGELVELKDWNGVVTLEYGKTGKLAKVTDHNGRITGYGYDANGNIASITYPDGSTVHYTFDGNNRISKVTDAEEKVIQYTYDPVGNIVSISQPGSTSSYTYNGNGLPSGAKYLFDDGTAMQDVVSYDATGSIIGVERTGSAPELNRNIEYTYDALHRLTSYRNGQTTEIYGYDALGNRTSKDVNGVRKATYQYNAMNQMTERVEDGVRYSYGYDRRGNLTEEKCGDSLVKQYLYDATGYMSLGQNLENGEKSEYTYNALRMRIKNVQSRQNRANGCHGRSEQGGAGLFTTRETSYVPDFLSGTGNELMSYEKGFGESRTVYGQQYQALSRKMTADPKTQTPGAVIAAAGIGKAYIQSDLYGSALFASSEKGDVLRYAERDIWGSLRLPMQGNVNIYGLEEGLRFTTYCHDPVIDKYYARARFYDAGSGRMLGIDPVKRGLNGYPYCQNDPVDYVDPTGEIIWNVILETAAGTFAGGVIGFADSAITQYLEGGKIDWRKAAGSAANGAITGGTKAFMYSIGLGPEAAFVANLVSGTIGSALEQKIGTGKASVGRSLIDGASNAFSWHINGNEPFRNLKDAVGRGMKAGAVNGGLNYLYDTLGTSPTGRPSQPGIGVLAGAALGRSIASRDPRSGCHNGPGYSRGNTAYGYQYNENQTGKGRGFNLLDFGKEVLKGSIEGGVFNAALFGAGKAVEKLVDKHKNIFDYADGQLDDIPSNVWKEGPAIRGNAIDEAKAIKNNLGHNFPTVDSLNDRVLSSTKSYDTTSKTYLSSSKWLSRIKGDVNKLSQFGGDVRWKGKVLDDTMYDVKRLNIVLPNVSLADAQKMALQQARGYAASLKIDTKVYITK